MLCSHYVECPKIHLHLSRDVSFQVLCYHRPVMFFYLSPHLCIWPTMSLPISQKASHEIGQLAGRDVRHRLMRPYLDCQYQVDGREGMTVAFTDSDATNYRAQLARDTRQIKADERLIFQSLLLSLRGSALHQPGTFLSDNCAYTGQLSEIFRSAISLGSSQ